MNTYRYLVNLDGTRFDELKIKWPGHIGTWPPQTGGAILAIITQGSHIEDGVAAIQAAYPEAKSFQSHGEAVKALIGK